MWKDYFYFSKEQQIGIIVFIILILLVLLICYSLPYFKSQIAPEKTVFLNEAKSLERELAWQDSIKQAEQERRIAENKKKQLEYENKKAEWAAKKEKEKEKIPTEFFKFNPNTADSSELRSLGLSPRVIKNILNYRKKGKFKKAEDLKKIYGLSEKMYLLLEAYISIPPEIKKQSDSTRTKEEMREQIIVELNSADTTTMMRIVGLGPYSAKEIVFFRQKTGGFYSTEQLREIKSIRAGNLSLIIPYCRVDSSLIRRINVNSASVAYLKSHPYINFYQAKAIYEYRKAKGEIKGIKELKKLPDFTDEDWERLQHYLSFE